MCMCMRRLPAAEAACAPLLTPAAMHPAPAGTQRWLAPEVMQGERATRVSE